VANDRAPERYSLTLASGELPRLALEQLVELEEAGGFVYALPDVGPGVAAHLQAEGHVVVNGHVGVERVGLKDNGHVAVACWDVVDIEPTYPASDSADDLAAAERDHAWKNAWFLDPPFHGSYPNAYLDQDAALRAMDVREGDLDQACTVLDFLGLNVYGPAVIATDESYAWRGVRQVPGPGPKTDIGSEIWPASIYQAIKRIDSDYSRPPIYITENGCAFSWAEPSRKAATGCATSSPRAGYDTATRSTSTQGSLLRLRARPSVTPDF
jgi:hypothetical protein